MTSGRETEINEKKRNRNREKISCSNDDSLAFIPIEKIRIIERVIDNLEEVKKRLGRFGPIS